MDIYDYLKKDHKKVEKFFKLFESATTERNKLEIVALIRKELLLHAISEQETFYKILSSHPDMRKDILHSEREHDDITAQLEEVSSFKHSNEALRAKMLKLKNTVMHHVKEEHGKIFREAKKILSQEDANIIKEKMHAYKEKLLHEIKIPDFVME